MKKFLTIAFAAFMVANANATLNFPTPTTPAEMERKIADNGCYQIGSVADLYAFAGLVNADLGFDYVPANRRACGELTTDIEVNTDVLESVNNGSRPTYDWLPIKDFSGIFLGHGHTISGLYATTRKVYKDGWLEDHTEVGLFEELNGSVLIKDVHIKDSYFEGSDMIGGIAGQIYDAQAVVDGCSFDGKVFVTGNAGKYAGGLFGLVSGSNLILSNSEVKENASIAGENNKYGAFIALVQADEHGANSHVTIYNSVNSSSAATVLEGTTYVETVQELTVPNYSAAALGKMVVVDPSLVTATGITFSYSSDNKVVAKISDENSVSISRDVTVDSVEFSRSFVGGAMSTIVLPFSIAAGNVASAEFYDYAGIDKNDSPWKVAMAPLCDYENTGCAGTETLEANHPYYVKSANSATLNFVGKVTLVPAGSTSLEYRGSTTAADYDADWALQGVYGKKTWLEGDAELGSVYGQAAKDKEDSGNPGTYVYRAGDFIKAGKNSYIKAMRAYLVHRPSALTKKRALTKTAAEELPSMMTYKILPYQAVESIGQGTETDPDMEGPLGIVKAQKIPANMLKMDRWYDVKGRSMKMPAARGAYIKNDTPVIVK